MADEENKWVIRKLNIDGFDALAMINSAYSNFTEKAFFPFLLSVELSLIDTINDLPTGEENIRLTEIEENLLKIFSKTQKIQYIGHVTRKGWRDILCYTENKNLDSEEIGKYCDSIEQNRNINIEINEDPEWKIVDGII
jgi:hypothetical protein